MGFGEMYAGEWDQIRWVVNGLTRGRIWEHKKTDSKMDETISSTQRTPLNQVPGIF